MRVEEGTPQDSSISPVLANVHLHHVFDLWVRAWRRKQNKQIIHCCGLSATKRQTSFSVGAPHLADRSAHCTIAPNQIRCGYQAISD